MFYGRSRAVVLYFLLASVLGVFPLPGSAHGQDKLRIRHHVKSQENVFNRIASFPVFLNTSIDTQTVAEIVAASEDGNILIYTDSEGGNAGFIDITDPANPLPAGNLPVGGEPTSVAVAGQFALVAVNTSESFTNPSGRLAVVNIASRKIIRILDLSGQPDSVAVSPDRRFAAIAIENERDEDLGDGRPPQSPSGFLAIVDLIGGPDSWRLRQVNLEGIADLFPGDPEPEFVDINEYNIAALTLQENNHIILIDLATGNILDDFSAGSSVGVSLGATVG